MTPKEKAAELVEKFLPVALNHEFGKSESQAQIIEFITQWGYEDYNGNIYCYGLEIGGWGYDRRTKNYIAVIKSPNINNGQKRFYGKTLGFIENLIEAYVNAIYPKILSVDEIKAKLTDMCVLEALSCDESLANADNIFTERYSRYAKVVLEEWKYNYSEPQIEAVVNQMLQAINEQTSPA